MQKKTKEKIERKERKTWVGYYKRITPTKKEKLDKLNNKYKNKQNIE